MHFSVIEEYLYLHRVPVSGQYWTFTSYLFTFKIPKVGYGFGWYLALRLGESLGVKSRNTWKNWDFWLTCNFHISLWVVVDTPPPPTPAPHCCLKNKHQNSIKYSHTERLSSGWVPAATDARWHNSLASLFCHSLDSSLSWDMRWAFVESFAPFSLGPIISALRWAYFLTGLRHN